MLEEHALRRIRRVALAAAVATLGAAAPAQAAITGTVTTSGGEPVAGVDITVRDRDGSTAGSRVTTNAAGAFSVEPSYSSADPPFTVEATYYDRCANDRLEAATGPLGDGAGAPPLVLDPQPFCSGFAFGTDTTALVLPESGEVLSGLGGTALLRVAAPSSATDVALTLSDGTVVGTAPRGSESVSLTAPSARYDGPLLLRFTYEGAVAQRQIGTLRAGPPPAPKTGGAFDLAAIVDVSGSMSGADPTYRRKDAVKLLVDLADNGDRLVGTGFDNEFLSLFPRTTVTGAAKTRLKRAADRKITNRGGTDYDVGFSEAFKALTADPLRPATPKGAIFLTDGAHNGQYDNTHLRFAYNGTGRAWPICVVQLGRGFSRDDTARLRRIARDTGGTYVATPTNTQLENLYFQCRGRTTGAKTVLRRTATFRVGQTRAYRQRVTRRQRKATFFVSFVAGKYQLRLTQPGGRTYRKTTGKRVRLVRSRTFAFFQVRKPKAGRWRLTVKRLRTGGRLDKATTTISLQRRGGKKTKKKSKSKRRRATTR